VLMQNIAHSITANHPDCYLIVPLIDVQPEEVTGYATVGEGRGGVVQVPK